jgi:hypothetical protein
MWLLPRRNSSCGQWLYPFTTIGIIATTTDKCHRDELQEAAIDTRPLAVEWVDPNELSCRGKSYG